MFCYEKPQFEKKRLLRIEMLEQIRDFPRDYLEILYSGFSDGILYGCTPGWDGNKLVIEPGILRYSEKLYFMKEPFLMECEAEDKIRYLKVQFQTLVQENGKIRGNTRIYLDDIEPNSSSEMELCRFRLQEGARLRDTYENFADCTTEFDTIHLLEVPWSSPGTATLHPKILRKYAKEILRKKNRDVMDISFAMDAIANRGIMPEEAIRIYIETRLGNKGGKGNKGLYRGLMEILKISGGDCNTRKKDDKTQRQMMLL